MRRRGPLVGTHKFSGLSSVRYWADMTAFYLPLSTSFIGIKQVMYICKVHSIIGFSVQVANISTLSTLKQEVYDHHPPHGLEGKERCHR